MSHPSSLSHSRAEHLPRHRAQVRAAPSAAPARRSDYTLVHAGRQVRLGPVAFWIVVGTLVIMAGWSIATGTYFAFRDDVLTRLIARQAEMQTAYEDRIAELRAQVDRITSRQLLDQEQFEQKLEGVVRRQSVLEQRASSLSGIADPVTTGSIPRGKSSEREPSGALKPSPISDTVIFVAPPEREARLESRTPIQHAAPRTIGRINAAGLEGMLSRMTAALDRVEAKQTATLNGLEETYDGKLKRMRGVLADLGVDVGKAPPHAPGIGGPYVPLKAPGSNASAFERQLYRINLARAQVDRYTRTLVAVPVRKPVFGEIDMSSPFGMRMDPFVRGPAIHTGLDMRGDTGDPVRATANGTVTTAGWNGGYGRMVEIDHGNGLSTRYGHLSEIDVRVGQSVKIGQMIGKIGSTGRSTGPHLHYETRVNDEAVDPQRFLRAGVRLGTL